MLRQHIYLLCLVMKSKSRGRLFLKGGGDDVARITTITMSRPSTLHKPPWTSKVSSFLYLSLIPHPLDGILCHASSLDDARVTTTSTCTREDGQGARGMGPVKAVAWKRRRKKSKQSQGAVLPLGQAVLPPLAQTARTRTTQRTAGPAGAHRSGRERRRVRVGRAATGLAAARPVEPARLSIIKGRNMT